MARSTRAVFLMQDVDTRRVYRLYARNGGQEIADCLLGAFTSPVDRATSEAAPRFVRF